MMLSWMITWTYCAVGPKFGDVTGLRNMQLYYRVSSGATEEFSWYIMA
jgi:hypothetical protein